MCYIISESVSFTIELNNVVGSRDAEVGYVEGRCSPLKNVFFGKFDNMTIK